MKNERMEGEQGMKEKREGDREKRVEFRRKQSRKEDLVAIETPVEAQPTQPPRLQLTPKAKKHSPQNSVCLHISSSSRIPGLLCSTALKDTGSEKEAEEEKGNCPRECKLEICFLF